MCPHYEGDIDCGCPIFISCCGSRPLDFDDDPKSLDQFSLSVHSGFGGTDESRARPSASMETVQRMRGDELEIGPGAATGGALRLRDDGDEVGTIELI